MNGANQMFNLLAEKSELSNANNGRRYRIRYDLPQQNRLYRYHISLSDTVTNILGACQT
jgi:hypothetical protein